MTTVHAYAAMETNGLLEPFEYELGPIGPYDVDIDVENCGICHSDLSMLENAWAMTQYPFVPGHEVSGKVSDVGEHVKHLEVGDRVGLGWHAGYCMICPECLSGHHNMCSSASGTIVERHGGFADKVRAQAASVIKLPDGLDARSAGPLLCGGITVFNPLVQFNISPTASVGVIGIGGLGHMALKFMRAWGCHVTAFTSSESKHQEAVEMGAHDTVNSRDPDAIMAAAGRFDLVMDPLDLDVVPLLFGQRSVSSSPVGSPGTIAKMIDFAARHTIKPITEHFNLNQVNEALDHLRSGKARYRIVLDCN